MQGSPIVAHVQTCLAQLKQQLTEESLRSEAPFCQDLVDIHKEEEDDLFFELAITDERVETLRRIGRQRLIS